MRIAEKSRSILLGSIVCVSLFLILFIFSRQSYDSFKGIGWLYEDIGQGTSSHSLKILSINQRDGTIKMEYSADFPPGNNVLFLNVDFSYDEWDLAHSESGFVWGGKILPLIEEKRNSQDIRSDEHPNNTYKTQFEFVWPINSKRFPFDAVTFEMWIYRDLPAYLSNKIDRAKFIKAPFGLTVYSYVDGYVLTKGTKRIVKGGSGFPDAEVVKFSLKRNAFTRIMTVLFFVLGIVTSLYIAFSWSLEKTVDLSVLTYFATLWGIRSILLDPIPQPKPFPTLIDIFVLSMMFMTPVLFALARKQFLQGLIHRLNQISDDSNKSDTK